MNSAHYHARGYVPNPGFNRIVDSSTGNFTRQHLAFEVAVTMFRNPLYLLWALLAAVAIWLFIRLGNSRREKISGRFGSLGTLARLLKPETSQRRNIKSLLQLGILVLLFLALAGG